MLTGADIFARIVGPTTGDAGVRAVVADRLYPSIIRAADVVYPYLLYTRENTTTDQSYDGPTGLASTDLKVAGVGNTQATAEAAANAVLAALDGDAGTWGTTAVQGCFLSDDGVSDDVVTDTDTEAVVAYVKEVRFTVLFETAAVTTTNGGT